MAETPAPARLLVTGAGGFVGQALQAAAARTELACEALTHSQLDITDAQAVTARIRDSAPAVVVNAAAFNDNDRAELEPAIAWRVNRDGPANLAVACDAIGAWLVHLSTDSVFGDIETEAGHLESATPAPISVYGHNKLAGEQAVRERCRRHSVLRLTWQFGPGDRSFVGAVTRRALREPEVMIATGQRGCPTPVARTAEALLALVHVIEAGRCRPGTWHFCAAGAVTRMQLAELIVAELRRITTPRVERLIPVPAERLDRARRPRCSVLDCSGFHALTGIEQPAWRDDLSTTVQALAAEMGVGRPG